MKRVIQPAAAFLLTLFALAWPWDVYQYIPSLGLHVTGLAALGLSLLWAADVVLARRNRVTFELAWPAALVVVFLCLPAIQGNAPLPLLQSALVLLFLATCHFAPSGDQVARYLGYSTISVTCVAAYSLLSHRATGPMPTAYSLSTGATLAFAHDITGGSLALFIGFAATLWFALDKDQSSRRRIAAAVGTVLILLSLLSVAVPTLAHVRLWSPPAYTEASLWNLIALLAGLWLAARIAAKLLFARREWNRRAATPFVAILAIALLMAIALPLLPRSAYPFLLGLAAACARAKHETESPPALAKWTALPLAGIVLLNLGFVHPENTLDPRNYNVAAVRDLESGNLDLLEHRMDFFEQKRPGERKTHFWRARAALRRGHPRRAALEFVQSMWPMKGPILMLPPPSFDEQEDFLVRLRDFCSSLPSESRVFAYERALLAAGRDDSALATLRLRITEPSLDVSALSGEPFARALAQLLLPYPRSSLEQRLAEWPAPELVSVLEQWGARLERAPEGFPEDALSLVLAAQVSRTALRVWTSGGKLDFLRPAPLNRHAETEETWGSGGWDAPERQPDGTWIIQLQPPEGPSASPWAEVTIDHDGCSTVRLDEVDLPPPHMPPEPAVRMWIP